MSKCRGCAKAVYFAERKTSLGYDWHPECLRCEECHKRLNPGQHAEHKGVPYCHVPCYSVLFGPTLFGHGSQVEAHTSFGKVEQRAGLPVPRSHLEAKLRLYNQQHEGKSTAVQCRERNGRLILEGSLRISWGVCHMIHLKEEHDDRMPVRRRNSCRLSIENSTRISSQDLVKLSQQQSPEWEDSPESLVNGSSRSLQSSPAHRAVDSQSSFGRNYKTLPAGGLKNVSKVQLEDENKENAGMQGEMQSDDGEDLSGVQLRRGGRCSRTKLRRRCSINGHFYNRETSVFMPTYGSLTSVWVTSLVTTPEVINMLLDKFKVQNKAEDFSLFVVRDSGEQRRILDNEYPLLVRILLGPNEDVARVFILEKNRTQEITNEVAQFINLAEVELQMFVKKFNEEEEREAQKIKEKYNAMKRYIAGRLYQLKAKELK